jgi:hypothetical protein
MPRRLDTGAVGVEGEAEAERLLTQRGWAVENLNHRIVNYPMYDLRASKNGSIIYISVKTGRSSNRHVRLGSYKSLSQLADDAFIFMIIPVSKHVELDIPARQYELWIIPGHARHIALKAHLKYNHGDESAAASHSVMIKDKVDRLGGRSSSGAAFIALSKYKDAWSVLPD